MPGIIVQRNQQLVGPGIGIIIGSGEAPPNLVDGVAAWLGTANWGPLGTATRLASRAAVQRTYSLGTTSGWTMDGAEEAFLAGALAVECIRAGSGGAKATLTLTDGAGTPVNVLRVDAKYPGSDGAKLRVATRAALVPTGNREFLVYDGTTLLETHSYVAGSDEAAAIVAAVGTNGSDFVDVVKLAVGDGSIPDQAATPLTGGSNPAAPSTSDIATAQGVLNQRPWFAMGTYIEDNTLHAQLRAAHDQAIIGGKRGMLMLGQNTATAWSSRVSQAKGHNNAAVVYVANGFTRLTTTGTTVNVEGYRAAGREAGRHALLRVGQQLTHREVSDAVAIIDELTSAELSEAAVSGMYVYGYGPNGKPRTFQGLTTQYTTAPPPWAESIDAGWGKSRLVKTRFSMYDDIANQWDPLIATGTNSRAGRAAFMNVVRLVIETKYMPVGAVEEYTIDDHPDNPPEGDSAWFLLTAKTPDGLERLYLDSKLRR